MKRLFVIIGTVSVFFLFFGSCYYDNEEVLYPVFKCDSVNITYDNTISKMMSGYCTSCHTPPRGQGGVNLTTYEDVIANETQIDLAIKHQGSKSPMPPGGKVSDCTIKQWDAWKLEGMLRN